MVFGLVVRPSSIREVVELRVERMYGDIHVVDHFTGGTVGRRRGWRGQILSQFFGAGWDDSRILEGLTASVNGLNTRISP